MMIASNSGALMVKSASTSLKLDHAIKERLQKLAESRDRTPHYVMREAIEEYLEREELRDEAWKAAMDAWEDFQCSGLHLTGVEANDWLQKLAAGEDADPPECHR